jgi:hypothetical protein
VVLEPALAPSEEEDASAAEDDDKGKVDAAVAPLSAWVSGDAPSTAR